MQKAPRRPIPWLGLPPIFVAACILAFGKNVYLFDEWDAIASLLIESAHKGFSAALLWAPHNEHRLPLPRLLFTLLHGRGPHLVLGMLLSLAVMGVCFALLHRALLRPALRATTSLPTPLPATVISVLFSVLFFSFGQKENLFWNFQLAWSIAICGLVLAALSLQQSRTPWFLLGLLLCYLSSAHWVALLPLVIIDGASRIWQGRRGAVWQLLLRLALFVVLFKLYARGDSGAPFTPFLQYAARQPLAVAEYFLTLLGNVHAWQGVSPTAPLALVGGALFLALAGLLFFRGALRPSGPGAPAFYLIVLTLALCTIICIGRSPLGTAQALDSRYQACTLVGWFALLATLLGTLGQRRWARWLLVGCLINVLVGSVNGLRIAALFDAPARQRGLTCQQAFIESGAPLSRPECARILYRDPTRQELLTRALQTLDLL